MYRDVEEKQCNQICQNYMYQSDYQGNVTAERLTGTRGTPRFHGTQSVYHGSTVFTNLVNSGCGPSNSLAVRPNMLHDQHNEKTKNILIPDMSQIVKFAVPSSLHSTLKVIIPYGWLLAYR